MSDLYRHGVKAQRGMVMGGSWDQVQVHRSKRSLAVMLGLLPPNTYTLISTIITPEDPLASPISAVATRVLFAISSQMVSVLKGDPPMQRTLLRSTGQYTVPCVKARLSWQLLTMVPTSKLYVSS